LLLSKTVAAVAAAVEFVLLLRLPVARCWFRGIVTVGGNVPVSTAVGAALASSSSCSSSSGIVIVSWSFGRSIFLPTRTFRLIFIHGVALVENGGGTLGVERHVFELPHTSEFVKLLFAAILRRSLQSLGAPKKVF